MISTGVYATFTEGSWRCYRAPNGRTPQYIGCRHLSPKSAVAHTANLDPFTSPLRASGSGATASDRGCPPSPGERLAPLPEPPSGSRLLDRPAI